MHLRVRRFSKLLSVCAFRCALSFLPSLPSVPLFFFLPSILTKFSIFCPPFSIFFMHLYLSLISYKSCRFFFILLSCFIFPLFHFIPLSISKSHFLFSIPMSVFITLMVLMRLDLTKCFEHTMMSPLRCCAPWCLICSMLYCILFYD